MAGNETIDSNAESFVLLLRKFEESGDIADLRVALQVRKKISEILIQASVNDGAAEKSSCIDCTRFDRFLHSIKQEAENHWQAAPGGKPWYIIPKVDLDRLKKAMTEFEKQLDIRRLIPKNSSPSFWQAFKSLGEQIFRGILNIQTIAIVVQKIPNNVV